MVILVESPDSRKRDKELTVYKYRGRQVDCDLFEGLSLGFVDGHGEGGPHRDASCHVLPCPLLGCLTHIRYPFDIYMWCDCKGAFRLEAYEQESQR